MIAMIQANRTAGWSRAARQIAVTFVSTILLAAPAQADALLGKSPDGSDSLSISPAGSRRQAALDSSSSSSLTKTGIALGIVVVAIVVAAGLVKKYFPGPGPESAGRVVRVLSQAPLGTKGTVYVLRCGPRVLIVGVTAAQMTTLTEIADPDEIDEFVRMSNTKGSAPQQLRSQNAMTNLPARDLKGHVDGMLDKIDSWKTN